MRFALIIITVALMIVVGFSVPAENISAHTQPATIEDSVPAPVYYDSVPVEYIDFEPLYVNVQYVALDTWEDANHSEL